MPSSTSPSECQEIKLKIEEKMKRLEPRYLLALERKQGILDMRDEADKLWYEEYTTLQEVLRLFQ